MKNQRDRMLLVLINVYIFATILYYVFLRNIVVKLIIIIMLVNFILTIKKTMFTHCLLAFILR